MANKSRRSFLKSAGLAAASLPLFNILKYGRAGASTMTAPLRLIQLYSPFQSPELYYHPQATSGSGFASAGSSFNLTFANSILAPLAPFQKNLIVFRGLSYGAASNSHNSEPTAFSGAKCGVDSSTGLPNTAAGTSLDQYLFKRMAQTGSLDPINAGLRTFQWDNHSFDWTLCWNAGNPLAMVADPHALFSTYFGNFTPPSSSGMQSAAQAAVLARRQKALGVAKNGLDAMVAQLPSTSPSYTRLQQHQTSLAGLTATLSSSSSVSLASCTPPTSSAINTDNDNTPDFVDWAKDYASFVSIITEAFACDITRFATIKMSNEDDDCAQIIPYLPGLTGYSGSWHGDITHTATDSASNASDTKMAVYKNAWMTLVAQLLKALQGIADPYSPSQSLYDNTVVIINSEGPIQAPTSDLHNNGTSDQPIILAGGCGGLFNMGQLIDVRSMGKVASAPGIAHNALLTNVVNAFENNQKAFNASYTPMILSQYGDYSFPVSATSWLTT